MRMSEIIETKLTDELAPDHLVVRDDSHMHEGHAGARPGGQTHFYIEISAESLENLPRVKQHQAIYRILTDELKSTIHALQIKVKKRDAAGA